MYYHGTHNVSKKLHATTFRQVIKIIVNNSSNQLTTQQQRYTVQHIKCIQKKDITIVV